MTWLGWGWENKKPDSVESGSAVEERCLVFWLRVVHVSPTVPSRSFGPNAHAGGLNGGRKSVAQIDGEIHEVG